MLDLNVVVHIHSAVSLPFPTPIDVSEILSTVEEPSPFPQQNSALYRRILADLGGISSITKIHSHVQHHRPDLLRQHLTSSFKRQSQIKSLGAGYYSFVEMNVLPVHQWLYQWLSAEGTKTAVQCIEAILRHYPNGDANSISRWLAQGVPNIRKTWNGYKPSAPSKAQRQCNSEQ